MKRGGTRAFRLGWGTVVLMGLASTSLASSKAHMGTYGPAGPLVVRRPTLRWLIYTSDRAKPTAFTMRINGQPVAARYDLERRELAYAPREGFPEGEHQVECRVEFEGFRPLTKEWKFRVQPGSLLDLPSASSDQSRALDLANAFRRRLGLPLLRADLRLHAAALNHSTYLHRNNQTGHGQAPGLPSFLARAPHERMSMFGWTEGSFETLTYGDENLEASVTRIFEAPYHRVPFMQPGEPAFGAGFSVNRLVLCFGWNDDVRTSVSPAPGEEDVPRQWTNFEVPNPLRLHPGAPKTLGYPIVMARFDPQITALREVKATLTGPGGAEVPTYVNSPANDEFLKFAVVIFPRRPLEPLTEYSVSVRARDDRGLALDQVWRFRTGR